MSLRSTRKGYRHSSYVMGGLILFSIIFSPWAFGTVHNWAINTMNLVAFSAGLLLIIRCIIRRKLDPQNRLYDAFEDDKTSHWLENSARLLSFIFVIYSLIYVINPRAIFDPSTRELIPFDSCIRWLPHSYDRDLSWNEFLRLLALIITFWATRDWLLDSILHQRIDIIHSLHRRERSHIHNDHNLHNDHYDITNFSPHSKLLLIILVFNAGLIAFIGILQKLGSNDQLLWFFTPEFRNSRSHFGPFVYRGNAVVYLNLAWCLAMFLTYKLVYEDLRKYGSRRFGQGSYLAVIPGLALIILASFMTNSRMGVIICLLSLLGIALVSIIKSRRRLRNFAICLLVLSTLAAATITLGGTFAFERIRHTLKVGTAPMQEDRYDIYKHLPKMIANHTLWGVGPGAFSTVYFFHREPQRTGTRNDDRVSWSAWAHTDPIETLITFGVVGSILIVMIGIFIIAFSLQKFRFRRDESSFEILSIGICAFMIHSCFDFPFQVYSLAHLFIISLALFSVQWHPSTYKKEPDN